MNRTTENKIILITRQTRLDELIVRFNTESQARFYLESLGADFAIYQQEDCCYKQALIETQKILSYFGRVQRVDRSFLANFMFANSDTVVVLGQDGLVANVLKYLDQQPVIGVNPDPEHLEGVLLPFYVNDLKRIIPALFKQNCEIKNITMAKAQLTTGHVLYSVNDFFIGAKTHTSARYQLEIGGNKEQQSSSGIIVSTGLGSTGWLKSILAGAKGISASITAKKTTKQPTQASSNSLADTPWDANYLYFSVREPWPSKNTSAEMTFGKITATQPLQIYSQMPDNGVIFSDGIEKDFVEFQAGTMATISIADKQGHIVLNR
jgi:NAD kinase